MQKYPDTPLNSPLPIHLPPPSHTFRRVTSITMAVTGASQRGASQRAHCDPVMALDLRIARSTELRRAGAENAQKAGKMICPRPKI